MSGTTGYHKRGVVIGAKICNLLCSLRPSTYDEISPKIGYWIEHALTEQSMNTDDLVGRLSSVAWDDRSSNADIARFLKEFHDAPHRSQQAKSAVNGLCSSVVRWFAAASAEDIRVHKTGVFPRPIPVVSSNGVTGFLTAASFVGHIIERGLVSHDIVRRYLVKPLIAHHYTDRDIDYQSIRAMAIYNLFLAARGTLLEGLLEPEDLQACFKMLDTNISLEGVVKPDAVKINELRELHASWLKRKEEEDQDDAGVQESRGEGGKRTVTAEVPADVETPVAFAPQDLPIVIDLSIHSSILHSIKSPSVLHGVESSSDTHTNDRIATVSSPTLSISTISDLTPTELGEDVGECNEERMAIRHDTFYLEDGNVEIVCGLTIFRVHSPIISFSSSKLRDMLSPSTLLDAPMPEGCPRVIFKDSSQDFAVLLKLIYTPGFPARNKVPEFSVFASLIRMAAKYGFSDVREQLVGDLKGAYPTKWEDFQAAKVLGEDVFGSPKPHPNTVLNLFLQQHIKFALPFAACRAGLSGFSTLVSNSPDTVLPHLTLAFIIHGMGEIRRAMTIAAYSIVCSGNLGVCAEWSCVLKVGINPTEPRTEALRKIFDVMVRRSEGDTLSSLSLGTLVCVDCAKRLEMIHCDCRQRHIWAVLPNLLGWESWEGV